jgi:hypothetical protein
MSYGIEITNNAGQIVIDQDYSNYAVYSSGTLYQTPYIDANGYLAYPDVPLLIPNVPGALVFVSGTLVTPVNGSASYMSLGYIYVVSGGWAGSTLVLGGLFPPSIEYVIVVPASGLPVPSDYGLTVFKSDGTLAFSSSYDYMRLAAVVTMDVKTAYTEVVLPASSKKRYLGINACHRNGIFYYSGTTTMGNFIAGGGDVYLAGGMVDQNTFCFSGNNAFLDAIAWEPNISWSWYQVAGYRSILILEI